MSVRRASTIIFIWFCTMIVVKANKIFWKPTFERIFGPNPGNTSILSDAQLMSSMMYLHETAKDVEDLIAKSDREKVEFWFGKVFGLTIVNGDTQDCNAAYVQRTSELFQRQNTGDNPNFQKIYIAFLKNIVQYCEGHFAGLISGLASEVSQNKLLDVLKSYSESKRECSAQELARRLTKPLLQDDVSSMGSGLDRVKTAIENPCGIILSTLKHPDSKPYSDFVDMCLFGARDILLHCSEPIQSWVSVVDMCKNLVHLTPSIANYIDKELEQAVDLWKKTYHEIFGPIRSVSMSEPQLLKSLMFLHAKADRFTVDEADKKIVKFWHSTLTDFNIHDCSVDEVQRISMIYAQQNIMNNPNFQNIYIDSRATMIRYCDSRFPDLPARLASRVIDNNLLNYLREEAGHPNSSQFFTQDLGEKLADSAIRSFEAGHREARVLEAWRRGSCEKILDALKGSNMKEYSDFVAMSLLDRGKYLKYCTRPSQIWMTVVDVCNRLNDKIQSFTKSNFSLRIAIRTYLMLLSLQT